MIRTYFLLRNLAAGLAVLLLGAFNSMATDAGSSISTNSITPVVCAFEQLTVAPVEERGDGTRVVHFRCEPGLVQMSIFFDAAGFDWESLYQVFNDFHNAGARTGPWDFESKTATPLVPSYWITVDGQKLGLWYAQRVSLEDVANKRFRGRFAFDVRRVGEHVLELTPFKPVKVTWMSARLERDPEDQLQSNLHPLNPPAALPSAAFADPLFWKAQQQKLATTHHLYQQPIQTILESIRKGGGGMDSLPWLVAAYHLDGNAKALTNALALVDHAISLPAWGRPREDVYGHNGDIGGGIAIRNMAFAYHMLGPELGEERRIRLLKKLAVQGDEFLTQALLMRDYWGGSLLQDHGWRALADFGTAALQLWGVIPEADRWVAYAVPRLQRAMAAAPPEGAIPGSSYYSAWLYGQNVMWYRDALLARTGVDLLEQPAFGRIPAFMASVYDEQKQALFVVENGDKIRVFGSEHLLAAVAAKFHDGAAARLHQIMVESALDPVAHGGHQAEENTSLLWGWLAYDPTVTPAAAAANPVRQIVWYPDAGFVQYRNDEQDVALALRCGPWLGYHAQRQATGPCDQMECRPGMGHFALFLKGEPILVSPDLGYKLNTRTSSALLVDDQGQIGDAGYPMSIPSQPHSGAQVESVQWDPATGRGTVRLDLKRAYPVELGVTHYTREFLVFAAHRVICRDTVVLNRPRRLTWLFQFNKDLGAEIESDLTARIGAQPALRIRPEPAGLTVTAKIASTPVVYSYASKFSKFDHVEFATVQPVQTATVDFVMEWSAR